jgi:hypothetical protein
MINKAHTRARSMLAMKIDGGRGQQAINNEYKKWKVEGRGSSNDKINKRV